MKLKTLLLPFTLLFSNVHPIIARSQPTELIKYNSIDSPAQDNIRPVKIGELVPNVFFKEILNYKLKSANLHDFIGKPLILDFWSTWCGTCIEQFPKIRKLREKYSSQIEILPVGFDYKIGTKIKTFIQERNRDPYRPKIDIPTVVLGENDHALSEYFPSEGFPLLVWVDKMGIVRQISRNESLNEENLEAFISASDVSKILPLKNLYVVTPQNLDHTPVSKLISEEFTGTVFYPYVDTLASTYLKIDTSNNNTRAFIGNRSIVEFFKLIYQDEFDENFHPFGKESDKRVVIQSNNRLVKCFDKTKSTAWENENYRKAHEFNFELRSNNKYTKKEILVLLQDEIFRNFKVKGNIEIRETECLVLRTISEIGKIRTKGGQELFIYDNYIDSLHIQNISSSEICNFFNTKLPYLVFDETNINFNLDIDMRVGGDITLLNLRLRSKGLELKKEIRSIKMIVISENDNSTNISLKPN